jgi:hypothetical protein
MMLDLSKMREVVDNFDRKHQLKTFLSPVARERLEAAASMVGVPRHQILEELVMNFLPPVSAQTAKRPGVVGAKTAATRKAKGPKT